MRGEAGVAALACGALACGALALTGCGGRAGTTAGTSTGGGACLVVAPMRLLALEHGTEWEPLAELRADGTLVRSPSSVVGSITHDQLLDRAGKPFLWCASDRQIHVAGHGPMAHFDADDHLVDADGSTLTIDDDGTVHWIRDGRDVAAGARLEGGYRGARRTAAFVVLATLFSAAWAD